LTRGKKTNPTFQKTITALLVNPPDSDILGLEMVTLSTPAPNSNAARQARWRARQKEPIHHVARIEYQQEAVLMALVTSGRLTKTEIWHRDLVEEALSIVITEWAEKVNNK
jgi:hypothetical protein